MDPHQPPSGGFFIPPTSSCGPLVQDILRLIQDKGPLVQDIFHLENLPAFGFFLLNSRNRGDRETVPRFEARPGRGDG